MAKESEAIRDLADMTALVVDTAKAAKEFVEKWAGIDSPPVKPKRTPQEREANRGPRAGDDIAFTEERIRAVLQKHYPHLGADYFIQLLETEEF